MPRLPGSKNKKPRKGPILTEKKKKGRGRPRKTPKPEEPKKPRGRPRKVKTPKVKKPVGRPKKEQVPSSKGSGMTAQIVDMAIKGVIKQAVKGTELERIERELAPTLVHKEKKKKKKEIDESWEIRKRREPYYDPKIPLETHGGFRRKYTITLEENVKDRFDNAVSKNSLYGSYVLNELMKMYSAGEIEIKPNYDDIAKWPWGLLEPNGEVVTAKPGTPVPIWDEWDTQKAERLKREAEERKQKKAGSKKSFKCPYCKKGRGTLHVRAEDPDDKWYECNKCHKTWTRMKTQADKAPIKETKTPSYDMDEYA